MNKRVPKPLILIFSLIVSFVAAALGSLATIPNIPTWYAALEKPLLNPPNWVFGPVWTILYTLMGIALYLVIVSKRSVKNQRKLNIYLLFAAQLTLNALWSITFFGLHLIEAAVAVILILLASIVLTIVKFWPYSPLAAKLLIPYALWVSFAAYLTIGIAFVN
jgi:benzodiazapine receptor